MLYEFEGFLLDTRRRSLTGPEGSAIALKPKVFDTLVYFVEHAGEFLDKRILLNAIWGGVVVEENGLNQHISTLRRVLREAPGENRFIVTLPSRGYRFVAPVRTRLDALGPAVAPEQAKAQVAEIARKPPSVGWRRVALATVLGGLGLAVAFVFVVTREKPAKLIAVLPCVNMTADPAKAFFTSGVHEELISQLEKIDLEVIARTSVMTYRDELKPIPTIARELGVSAIVECSVRYAENEIRITAALIDAQTSDTLWRESYDRALSDDAAVGNVLAIQSDIALHVARELEAKLSPAQISILAQHPTRSLRAYEFYLTARSYESRELMDLPIATQLYERAVETDPEFALAWARLALARFGMRGVLDPSRSLLDEGKAAVDHALKLNPMLPEARIAMAHYHLESSLGFERALEELSAIEANTRNSSEFFDLRGRIYLSLHQTRQGFLDIERAVALDPRNAVLLIEHSGQYVAVRRYDDADRLLDRGLELAPDSSRGLLAKGYVSMARAGDTAILRELRSHFWSGEWKPIPWDWFAALYERDYEAALRLVERMPVTPDVGPSGSWDVNRLLLLGTSHYLGGDRDAARHFFEAAREQGTRRLPGSANNDVRAELLSFLALALAGLDEREEAVRVANQAIEVSSASVSQSPWVRLWAVQTFARVGNLELAIETLDDYLAQPGEWSIEGLLPDPRIDALREDPRFKSLVKKYKRL